jgi:hypothetical protein
MYKFVVIILLGLETYGRASGLHYSSLAVAFPFSLINPTFYTDFGSAFSCLMSQFSGLRRQGLSTPACPWAGSTWIAVMTNNPSFVELETLVSPTPQPLLPLSQAGQDEWPPPFVLNSNGLPFSVSLEKNPYTCSATSLVPPFPLSLSAFTSLGLLGH